MIMVFFDCIDLSTFVLLITGIFIAWQAWETQQLAKLTRIKDQPLLEIEFPNNGAKIVLKNIGRSPAYSPSMSSLQISANERLDFDPLHTSRLPIPNGESQKFWIHHKCIEKGSISSFADSITVLKKAIINRNVSVPFKIVLQYFDKDGVKLKRDLFIKLGGNKISSDQSIYTSTSPEG